MLEKVKEMGLWRLSEEGKGNGALEAFRRR